LIARIVSRACGENSKLKTQNSKLRTHPSSDPLHDLAWIRETPDSVLGENQLAVHDHVEDAVPALDEPWLHTEA
jgi:hypothetical protein